MTEYRYPPPPPFMPGLHRPEWTCRTCRADFSDWLRLDDETRAAVLREHPEFDIMALVDDHVRRLTIESSCAEAQTASRLSLHCPRCGAVLAVRDD